MITDGQIVSFALGDVGPWATEGDLVAAYDSLRSSARRPARKLGAKRLARLSLILATSSTFLRISNREHASAESIAEALADDRQLPDGNFGALREILRILCNRVAEQRDEIDDLLERVDASGPDVPGVT